MSVESPISKIRRKLIVGAMATAALVACGDSEICIFEPQKTPENFCRVPEDGDMVYLDGKPYAIVPYQALGIRDPIRYWINSKGAQYGRKIFEEKNLSEYVRGDLFNRHQPHDYIAPQNYLGRFSGHERVVKVDGGEILGFWGGAITHRGHPIEVVDKDNEPFQFARSEFEELGWLLQDEEFFTLGEVPFNSYKRRDTLGSVHPIIRNGISFISALREDNPYDQQNHIMHSAGGNWGYPAIMANISEINNLIIKNMNVVNNIFMLAVPIRGFMGGITPEIRRAMEVMGWTEKDDLIRYLLNLPNDKDYQQQIEKDAKEFTDKGRKITVIIHENDPIANIQNAMLPGAELVVISGGEGALNPWAAHGAPLSDPKSIKVQKEKIGRNLGKAA